MKKNKNNSNSEKKKAFSLEGLFSRVKSIFTTRSEETKNENEESPQHDSLKEMIDRIDASESPIKVSLIPEDLRSDFHAHVRNMAISGFNDGVKGLKSDAHLKIASEKADKFYREFSAHAEYKSEAVRREIVSKEKIVESKLQQATLHHGYQNYLQHHYKFNERGNTIGESLLYTVIFLIIFMADIPLAVETIRRIYPTYMGERPFSFQSIGEHWEAFLTAVGLASSSIYIKIWYDEFVGKKYGHAVISNKKFLELFSAEDSNGALTEEEKRKIKNHERYIKIIKSIILLFTLTVITVLGIFRKYAWMKSQGIISTIPRDILSVAFVFITLLFSIISGICLSIALNAWTNYNRLRRCKHETNVLEKDYLKESKELAALQGEKAKLEVSVSQWADRDDWIEKVRELLSAYYDIGYNEGLAEPGYYIRHLDFFDRILLWRENITARKISKSATS